MLWNWYTVDACFLFPNWQVRSSGSFATLCITVVCLVMFLEGLRRTARDYDSYLKRSYLTRNSKAAESSSAETILTTVVAAVDKSVSCPGEPNSAAPGIPTRAVVQFRPGVLSQAIRALLYTLQFAVAYFIML